MNNITRESTSNSMKFAPMPMSVLLNMMPKASENQDLGGPVSEDSDEDSVGTTVAKKPSPSRINKELVSSTPKVSVVNNREFVSERKFCKESDKENKDQSISNWTYPHKETSNSGGIKNVLTSQNHRSNLNSVSKVMPRPAEVGKKTPEMARKPMSSHKPKVTTPVIKPGIRRFTPGSGRKSNKKTPQKKLVQPSSKERVRCLFPDNPKNEENPCPTPRMQPQPQNQLPHIPDTPMSRPNQQMSSAATPSYPHNNNKNQSKILFKTTMIKGKNYMYIKKLGIGGSSEVYKVLEVGTSNEYAVKCVNLSTDPEMARGYVNEVRLLRELQGSDRVIRLYDYEYERDSKVLRVVLEVGETDLSSFLRARGSALPPALVMYYWEEMLLAVQHIHNNGVIHADLKPANFLLVCGRLKLIDFGIASCITGDATSVVRAQAQGTYSYISPEALAGGAGGRAPGDDHAPIKISYKSDVWSLGCILYSMMYGRTPFGHIPSLAKLAAILDPRHRIDYPPVDHLPPSLLSALKWCLTYNARARPSVAELLRIPYMQAGKGPLPQTLLDKVQPHVSNEEMTLLRQAQV